MIVPGGAGAMDGFASALADGLALAGAAAAALAAGFALAAALAGAAAALAAADGFAGGELAGAGAAPPQSASSRPEANPMNVNRRDACMTILLREIIGSV